MEDGRAFDLMTALRLCLFPEKHQSNNVKMESTMKTTYTFSAPGRTEISGNQTDHQHGCVLAAAVNLETVA